MSRRQWLRTAAGLATPVATLAQFGNQPRGASRSRVSCLSGRHSLDCRNLISVWEFLPGADSQILYDVWGNAHGRLGYSTGSTGEPSDPTWTTSGLDFNATVPEWAPVSSLNLRTSLLHVVFKRDVYASDTGLCGNYNAGGTAAQLAIRVLFGSPAGRLRINCVQDSSNHVRWESESGLIANGAWCHLTTALVGANTCALWLNGNPAPLTRTAVGMPSVPESGYGTFT